MATPTWSSPHKQSTGRTCLLIIQIKFMWSTEAFSIAKFFVFLSSLFTHSIVESLAVAQHFLSVAKTHICAALCALTQSGKQTRVGGWGQRLSPPEKTHRQETF